MFETENSGGMFLFFIGLIIVFAILFNGGGGLFGGNRGGDCATKSELCDSFNFNNLENGVARLGQGLCDSTYALNNSITGGFHSTDMGICGVNHNIDQCLMNLKETA